MKLGILLSRPDPETVFNALRLGNFALARGDTVRVFLVGAGVEIDDINDPKFDVKGQAQVLLSAGGQFLACGTCLKLRHAAGSEICPLSTMQDMYDVVRDSDRVLTF